MQKPQLKLFLLIALVFLGSLVFINPTQAIHLCKYGAVDMYEGPSCSGTILWTDIGDCGLKPCGLGCSEGDFIGPPPDNLFSDSHEFMSIAVADSTTCDHMPTANAGPDQTVIDSAPLGSESITLNGFGSSDPDGFGDIAGSFVWKEGVTIIATGAKPTVSLGIGAHAITLTITDLNFNSDTDTVVITIIPVYALSVTHTCSVSSCPTDPPTTADTVTFTANAIHSLPIDFSTYKVLISTDSSCTSYTPHSCGANPCTIGPLGPYLDGRKVCYYGDFKDTAGNLAVAAVKSFKVTSNKPPVVNAGPDQTITLPALASLDGTVSDDGLPNPPAAITTTWTKISGPGTVTFGSVSSIDTTASFSLAGTYVLRLTASDSMLSAFDEVTVKVNPAPIICSDPDGSNITTQGICTDSTPPPSTDSCFSSSQVKEFQCVSNECTSSNITCAAGKECVSGACVDIAAVCTDPDGSNTAIQGTCTDAAGPKTDSCDNPTTVKEFQCDFSSICAASSVSCGAGKECSSGKCVDIVPPPCGGLGQACCATGDPCPGLTCSGGICITPPPPPPSCPNAVCGVGEDCANCAADCGACPPPPPPPPSCASPNLCVKSSDCITGTTPDTCLTAGDVCCLPPPPPPPGKPGGLVPCGRVTNNPETLDIDERHDCTFCDFFILFKNIIDFIMWTLAPILGVLLIVLGGFLILTSRGSSSQYNQGKMFIIWALAGFVLMLIAWILINSVFSILKLQDWTGLKVGEWWKVTCEVETVVMVPLPIAHWDFNQGSGIITTDVVGSNDGTIAGSAAWVR